MKKVYLLVLLATLGLRAQESGKFRTDIELGYAAQSGANGYFVAIEPKFNIADDMNIGLRIASTYFNTTITDPIYFEQTDLDAGSLAIGGTFDYYFDDLTGSSFTPFAGAGVQYAMLSNDYVTDGEGKIGGFVRLGFEWGKLRVGAEYNLIPSSAFVDTYGSSYAYNTSNSYIGITVGIFIGGGKW